MGLVGAHYAPSPSLENYRKLTPATFSEVPLCISRLFFFLANPPVSTETWLTTTPKTLHPSHASCGSFLLFCLVPLAVPASEWTKLNVKPVSFCWWFYKMFQFGSRFIWHNKGKTMAPGAETKQGGD